MPDEDNPKLNTDIEEAILYAKKYLEDLLSFFGLNTDVYATTQDHEVIELNVPSTHLNGFLIGQRGETARALQYTIATALKNQNSVHAPLTIALDPDHFLLLLRAIPLAFRWFHEVRD